MNTITRNVASMINRNDYAKVLAIAAKSEKQLEDWLYEYYVYENRLDFIRDFSTDLYYAVDFKVIAAWAYTKWGGRHVN